MRGQTVQEIPRAIPQIALEMRKKVGSPPRAQSIAKAASCMALPPMNTTWLQSPSPCRDRVITLPRTWEPRKVSAASKMSREVG